MAEKDTTLPEDEYELRPIHTNSSTVATEVVNNRDAAAKRTIESINEVAPHERDGGPNKKRKQQRGQNKGRKFNNSHDEIKLCPERAIGQPCSKPVGQCKFEHDLSVYLATKPEDITSTCPVYQTTGHCDAGFRCRWLSGHVTKTDASDPKTWKLHNKSLALRIHGIEIQNDIMPEVKIQLRKKQYSTPKSETYIQYLDQLLNRSGGEDNALDVPEVPFKAVEKRRLNWSQAKVLAPLTTTGNLPFRQICRQFGADVTYSEMAVSVPLLSGNPSEWALTRSHVSERDTRNGRSGLYGIQLAGPKPAMNLRAAEVLSQEFGSTLDFLDLNCGCRKCWVI